MMFYVAKLSDMLQDQLKKEKKEKIRMNNLITLK